MNLRPIGVVRGEVRRRDAMPSFGAPAAVEIFPELKNIKLRQYRF